MKRLFGFLLLFIAFNVSAIEINSKLSGSWYNPEQSGHGLNVEVLENNRTLIYWYAYHPDGTPMFLITIADNDGDSTSGTTYYSTGMTFGEFNPDDYERSVWGTSSVTFNDCNSATLEYSSNDPAYGSGSIPMVRLTFVSGIKCTDSPLHGTYFGAWANSGEVGYGIATLFENGAMAYGAGSDTTGEVGLGEWRVTGSNSFTFTATAYSVLGGWIDFSGSGNFNEDALTATYSGGGELIATPIRSFQHSLNTSKMAGTYNVHDSTEAIIGSATILSNGNVSGSTSLGCNFVGDLFVPNTNFNQAYLDLDVSNCGDTTNIIGSAVYNNPQRAIVIVAADGWYGYVWTLRLK